MADVINCVKCGRPLQAVFIAFGQKFKGGIERQDKDGNIVEALACINTECEDGKCNFSPFNYEVIDG